MSEKQANTDQREKETTEESSTQTLFDYELVVSPEFMQIIGNPHLLRERLKERENG